MKVYVLTEEERNQIIEEIQHAPALHVYNAITKLRNLKTANLVDKAEEKRVKEVKDSEIIKP